MALNAEELEWVRSIIGAAPPSDAELDTIHDRVDNAAAVVVTVLTQRRADLLAGPLQFAVDGYSQNANGNIDALNELIAEYTLQMETELGIGGVRIVQLTRDAPKR